MPPQFYLSRGPDTTLDTYSLGVTVYELLTKGTDLADTITDYARP